MNHDSLKTSLGEAAQAIKDGQLVAYPTDTVYGLGADATNAEAVDAVFTAKGRNPGTPVPVLISGMSMGLELVKELTEKFEVLINEFWPGALTIVVEATESVPPVVTAGTGTVGLRMPDNKVAVELIKMSGKPITGTSCNLSGEPPTKHVDEARNQMGDSVSVYVESECGDSTAPSTVISLVTEPPTIFRLGEIAREDIENIIGPVVLA
ncbi:MAG: L-threonylcarbamoyladenylate synthase [Chloroflexota bacterium]|jgi:L-threonylcarbamoyladenylate synthase